jgi:hypothetical protein
MFDVDGAGFFRDNRASGCLRSFDGRTVRVAQGLESPFAKQSEVFRKNETIRDLELTSGSLG